MPPAVRRYWTPAEVAFRTLHYAEQRTDVIAQALNRPRNTVLAKANNLGLSKSKALIAEVS
jgi:hypothetical protein